MRFLNIVTPAIIAVGACGCCWSRIAERQRRQSLEQNEERLRLYERMYGPITAPQTAGQAEWARKLFRLNRIGRWEAMEASVPGAEAPEAGPEAKDGSLKQKAQRQA